METAGKLLVGMAVIVLMGFLGALVMQTYWGWFVVPLNAPPIGLAHAYGLAMFVGYLKHNPSAKTEDSSFWEAVLVGVVYCAFALLFGYIVHGLM